MKINVIQRETRKENRDKRKQEFKKIVSKSKAGVEYVKYVPVPVAKTNTVNRHAVRKEAAYMRNILQERKKIKIRNQKYDEKMWRQDKEKNRMKINRKINQ